MNMEVITKDLEEVRSYFEALEQGMRYIDTVTAHFRPAMNGEVYLTGAGFCISRKGHCRITGRSGLFPTYPFREKRFTGSPTCCVCWRKTMWK